MITYLTNSLVSLNIDGNKRSYLNSKKNRTYLQSILSSEEWNKIISVWGQNSYVPEENELLSPQLEKIQNNKIKQLKEVCMKTITQGIDLNDEHYSFEITDQLNLSRLVAQAKEGKTQLIYHADGQPCRLYTAEEIIKLNEAMENFIEYHTTYFNSLKTYIKTLTLQSQITALQYGMNIPETPVILQALTKQ